LFDFLDSDWFIITLEVIFIVLIAYDVKQYLATKKKEYITNIVLTIGFAIWTLMPMYTKYFGWEEKQRQEYFAESLREDENATKLCDCMHDSVVKEFTFKEYSDLKSSQKELDAFIKESKEECLDDSWF